MRDEIKAVLTADTTLMALLTGSVHAGVEVSRQATPAAFDASSKELLPCALVTIESEAPVGPHETSSRQYVVIYFYERTGYSTIDQALDRVYALLHRDHLGSGVWEVTHAGDNRDLEDQALQCSMAFSRYAVTRLR